VYPPVLHFLIVITLKISQINSLSIFGNDLFMQTMSSDVIDLLISSCPNIAKLWACLCNFKNSFINWSIMNVNRSIEQLIISYYYRSEHIDKISCNTDIDLEQQKYMLLELKRQRNQILSTILMFDKTFDINYLKINYIQIFNDIQASQKYIQQIILTNVKKAYFDSLVTDVKSENMLGCFNLIKNIGQRLCILCPKKSVEQFSKKFTDDTIISMLQTKEFTTEIIEFINLMVDFIVCIDAPVNDQSNIIWKKNVKMLINNNFHYNFPLILISIEEHIDIIYSLITKL